MCACGFSTVRVRPCLMGSHPCRKIDGPLSEFDDLTHGEPAQPAGASIHSIASARSASSTLHDLKIGAPGTSSIDPKQNA